MSKTGGSKKNSRLARAKKLAKLGRLTGKAAAKTVVTAARTLPAVVGAVTAFAGTLRSGLKTITETTAVREAQPLKGEITMKKSTLIALIVFLSTMPLLALLVDAKVIQKTINKRNNYFILNKGRVHGVTNNMGVISPNGIVGVVVNVSSNFSLVMSVLHQDSRPNIKNQRTKISGTLVWEGGDYSSGKLVDIPSSIPLKIGDTIITSGFSQDFPEGIMVGKIKNFKKDKGTGFYVVDIKFSVDYNKLEYVYIVKNFFKEEQVQLTKDIKNE